MEHVIDSNYNIHVLGVTSSACRRGLDWQSAGPAWLSTSQPTISTIRRDLSVAAMVRVCLSSKRFSLFMRNGVRESLVSENPWSNQTANFFQFNNLGFPRDMHVLLIHVNRYLILPMELALSLRWRWERTGCNHNGQDGLLHGKRICS